MIALDELREFRAKALAELKPVEVPEWGCVGERSLRVTRLRADAWLRMKDREKDGLPESDDCPAAMRFWVELIAGCAVDSTGAYLFNSKDGRAFLSEQSFSSIGRLAGECLAFNGLGAKTDEG